MLGESKKTVKQAMDRLEYLEVIRREFRTIELKNGTLCNNVMYINLNPAVLFTLTYPESDVTLLPKKDIPYRPNGRDPISQTGGTLLPKREGAYIQIRRDPPSHLGETNTYITTENTSIDSINQSIPKNDIDRLIEQIHENVNYDWHMKNDDTIEKQKFMNIVDLMCELVCFEREEPFIVNGSKIPWESMKYRILKLRDVHISYVIYCLSNFEGKISNIRNYEIACLYNAPITMQPYWEQKAYQDFFAEKE